MLSFTQAGEGWRDHQAILAVSSQNRSDRVADAIRRDGVNVNFQRAGLSLAWQQQGNAQSQQGCESEHGRLRSPVILLLAHHERDQLRGAWTPQID